MNFVTLISQLLPIVNSIKPGLGGDATLLATAAANIIAYIQQQKNLTTDQILQRAGTQLAQHERDLLDDLARLQGAGGGAGGSGGSKGGGSKGGSKGGQK
jgi:hypothetical protein